MNVELTVTDETGAVKTATIYNAEHDLTDPIIRDLHAAHAAATDHRQAARKPGDTDPDTRWRRYAASLCTRKGLLPMTGNERTRITMVLVWTLGELTLCIDPRIHNCTYHYIRIELAGTETHGAEVMR